MSMPPKKGRKITQIEYDQFVGIKTIVVHICGSTKSL
jgi:hypothetical protein